MWIRSFFPIPDQEELKKSIQKNTMSDVKPTYIKRMEEDLDWWNINYDQRYDILEEI